MPSRGELSPWQGDTAEKRSAPAISPAP